MWKQASPWIASGITIYVESRKGALDDMGQQSDMAEGALTGRRAGNPTRMPRPGGRGSRLELVLPPPAADGGIERLCKERGLKMTGQRRTIARVLSEAADHPDVEELYRRAVLLDDHVSIATVYRTVRLLEEKGILQRRDFGSGRARYEPTDHGPHYHPIDVETGKVVEFKSPGHKRLVRALAEQLGFEMFSLRLEVFGRQSPMQRDAGQGRKPATGEAS